MSGRTATLGNGKPARHVTRRAARRSERRLQREHPDASEHRFTVERTSRGVGRWHVVDHGADA